MPETFGGYIDAYAALPGVTREMVAAYSDTAMDAEGGTLDAAAMLYEAARQIAEAGTYDGDLLVELHDLGIDDIPWFVIACAPTGERAMREIGLHMRRGLHRLAEDLMRTLAAVRRG